MSEATSPAPTLDVVGVGNALVDVLSNESFEFLETMGLTPGSMSLVDEAAAQKLYEATTPVAEESGGSAANTVAGVASFGGKAHFIGRVKADELGAVFISDIQSIGVGFTNVPSETGSPTGRCVVLVTPDAERTLNTYLGASGEFESGDVDPAVVSAGGILYLEGYLYDSDAAKTAFEEAAAAARAAGRKVALTLSDSFCVDRHRSSFLDFITDGVDILLANEDEICALFETNDFEDAQERVRDLVPLAALTRSEKGSVIVSGGETVVVAAEPIEHVIDTTGAGDQYAAGLLYGLSQGLGLAESARLGHVAAAEVISHIGARPEVSLASLL